MIDLPANSQSQGKEEGFVLYGTADFAEIFEGYEVKNKVDYFRLSEITI